MQVSSFLTAPRSIKILIWVTSIVSLLSPVITFIMMHHFHLVGPQQWLALSLGGMEQGWIWEPLSYLFIHSADTHISLGLLFSLFFHMLLLWYAGTEIAKRFGERSFFMLYFSAGLISGLVATALLYFFSSSEIVFGSGPAVYAALMVWIMLYPDLNLFFFFVIKLKAKWLILFLLGFALLTNISSGAYIPFIADLTGILFGFLVGRFVWKLSNPFSPNLEFSTRKPKKEDKIIDISVVHEDDDIFMERMLDKISKSGKDSLTKREQDRMRKISQRKQKDQK